MIGLKRRRRPRDIYGYLLLPVFLKGVFHEIG